MSWNTSLPADGTKVRIAPSQIRANWQGIQDGIVPYASLRLAQQGVNPTREDSRGFLFAKNPGSGFTELYYEDSRNPASVIQMTANGKVGSTATQTLTSGISYDDSYFYTGSNYVIARATVTANGTANHADGITVDNPATGLYTITVASGRLQNTEYQSVITPWLGSAPVVALIQDEPTVNPATPTIILVRMYTALGVLVNNKFNIVIVGGR